MDAFRSITTNAAEGLPRRRFTVADVEAMVEAGIVQHDERVELIGGELVPMLPKGLDHELVKIALLRRWYIAHPDDVTLVPATTLRLSLDTYLEPDVVVFERRGGLAEGYAALSALTALLVVEIADFSLAFDMGRKAKLFASFGVRELWVIDAVRRSTRLFRRPSADGYGEVADAGPHEQLTPLFAPAEFALALDALEPE